MEKPCNNNEMNQNKVITCFNIIESAFQSLIDSFQDLRIQYVNRGILESTIMVVLFDAIKLYNIQYRDYKIK